MNSRQFENAIKEVYTKYNFPRPLKENQEEILSLLLNGRNVCAVLPTGYGKSLVYWMLPCVFDCVRYFKLLFFNNLLLYFFPIILPKKQNTRSMYFVLKVGNNWLKSH